MPHPLVQNVHELALSSDEKMHAKDDVVLLVLWMRKEQQRDLTIHGFPPARRAPLALERNARGNDGPGRKTPIRGNDGSTIL